MLETLRRVRGVVSTKDLIPVLTHFCISGGRIQGSNGRVTIDAACPELAQHDFAVPADKFIKAIDACKGKEPSLARTDGFLSVSAGRVRVKLPTLNPEAFPRDSASSDDATDLDVGDVVAALQRIRAFISQDASRPWSCSVYFDAGYAYATNNVVFVRTPCSWAHGEPFVLPFEAVNELLRVGEDPIRACTSSTHITFYYKGDWWLRARLSGLVWPDLAPLIEKMLDDDLYPIGKDILETVQTLVPFFPDHKMPVVLFNDTTASTKEGAQTAEIDCEGLSPGAFRVEALLSVLPVATHWNLTRFPAPIPFRAPSLQGLFVGVRA
jgi:DNA polymerase III sliding clamp (beta) subunit (PCNA family)